MYIKEVFDGPAKEAGLQVQDILLTADNILIEDREHFGQIISDVYAGTWPFAELLILRDKNIICYRIEP